MFTFFDYLRVIFVLLKWHVLIQTVNHLQQHVVLTFPRLCPQHHSKCVLCSILQRQDLTLSALKLATHLSEELKTFKMNCFKMNYLLIFFLMEMSKTKRTLILLHTGAQNIRTHFNRRHVEKLGVHMHMSSAHHSLKRNLQMWETHNRTSWTRTEASLAD